MTRWYSGGHCVSGALRQSIRQKMDCRARWISFTESSCIHGITIPSGGFYVGSVLRTTRGHLNEPSLIDPRLPIRLIPFEEYFPRHLPRPRYDRLMPEVRRKYLEWLAGERKAGGDTSTFVWLYFYGLERRLVLDPGHDEYTAIKAEVERLAKEHAHNPIFAQAAAGLLAAVSPENGGVSRQTYVAASGAFVAELRARPNE